MIPHLADAVMRLKPGTDTKFPAQFAPLRRSPVLVLAATQTGEALPRLFAALRFRGGRNQLLPVRTGASGVAEIGVDGTQIVQGIRVCRIYGESPLRLLERLVPVALLVENPAQLQVHVGIPRFGGECLP